MPAPARSSARSSAAKGGSADWRTVVPAPLVLVQGTEGLLAERAVARVLAVAREGDEELGLVGDPELERVDLEAATYDAGMLAVATSPSLFDEAKVVVVRGAEACSDAFVTDMTAYAAAPDPATTVVVVHGGGQRGKRMLDAIRASGAPVVACDPIKKDADRAAFVSSEFRSLRRKVDAAAVRSLVEGLGNDLRELAAACSQLASDTTGTITTAVVDRYYGGRVEATGFRVADAAAAGDAGEAVALLRHALATGADPVPLVAALAMKLRALAKVAAMRGGGLGAKELGLAPWQVDRARKELTRWTPDGLAAAITAVAQADADVKGGGRDPVFAVERAVLTVARAASR
ncbi:DNA polymerase III delta subunit [Sediminihabitans luteus]|uniref:DNA-directed DNA polymerase n=1 Tax=Sediminihabitans luteus TaxID=1138585 RepID=A0A2M9CPX8_9CELL|nr:DNA polymerase III subunit delta [Sediminihabitans luteus]PJJ73915.1 DNA polymerase III delta subunit [Sediminihabitans luteus]GII98172.1 DNA-binding protein [Sediminihabitans luteus]